MAFFGGSGYGGAGVRLDDFIGEWRDSLGHQVRVDWARKGNRGGELDVQLIRPGSTRDPIRLNVKSLGQGQFQCGHYELEVDKSHSEKIVWGDRRNRGKTSVWERTGERNGEKRRSRERARSRERRSYSRSRSRSRRRSRELDQSGLARDVALRRSEHPPDAAVPARAGMQNVIPHFAMGGIWDGRSFQNPWNGWGAYGGHHPYMPSHPPAAPPSGWHGSHPGARPEAGASPSASVLREVSTPGAWAPPVKESSSGIYDDVLPTGGHPPPASNTHGQNAGGTNPDSTGGGAKVQRSLEEASQSYDQSLANAVLVLASSSLHESAGPVQTAPDTAIPLPPAQALPDAIRPGLEAKDTEMVPEVLAKPQSPLSGAVHGDAASSSSGPEDDLDHEGAVYGDAASSSGGPEDDPDHEGLEESTAGAPKEPCEPQLVGSSSLTPAVGDHAEKLNEAERIGAMKASQQRDLALKEELARLKELVAGNRAAAESATARAALPEDPIARKPEESASSSVITNAAADGAGIDANAGSRLESSDDLQVEAQLASGTTDEKDKDLSAYTALLLADESCADGQQGTPWQRQKRRRAAVAAASAL